jgi:hypothetical protein
VIGHLRCRSTGTTVYEVAGRPSRGGGQWYVLPDDRAFFRATDGEPRQSLITGHTLRVVATGPARRVIDITGLGGVPSIDPTLDDALAGF